LGFYRLTAAGIERGALVAACPDMTSGAATSAFKEDLNPPKQPVSPGDKSSGKKILQAMQA